MVACLPECRTRLCKRRARRHAPSPDHPGGEDECVCVCVCACEGKDAWERVILKAMVRVSICVRK